MKAQLRILSGARRGLTATYSKREICIGRHPGCDLQVDPDEDLEASVRHAIIQGQGNNWFIRDLGSLNGTYLNGHSISDNTPLDDTDQVRLGADGPTVEFRLVADSTPDGIVRPTSGGDTAEPTPSAASVKTSDPAGAQGATERIRVEVSRQTKRLRVLTAALALILLAVVTVFAIDRNRQNRLRERQAAEIEARTDSIIGAANQAVTALQGRVEGLAAALRASQDEVGVLRTALDEAERSGSADEVEQLRRRLADASQALLYQQAAAYVDYRSILEDNQSGVALIWVEFASGDVQTGTAFAVRSDGTMITAGHVVAGPDRTQRPSRMAVKFADSYQVYPARLIRGSASADLAAIKVDVPGGVPTVRGINQRADTVRQGDPVAIVGFPLGPDLPMSSYGRDRSIARTSFSAGSVSKVLADVVQIDGYGAEGSSGSPILDQTGEVIGMVYAGESGSDGRIVLGVPAGFVLQLLQDMR